MLLYAAKRIVLGIVILLIIVLALFSMIHVLPGDPVVVALGPHATLAMREHPRLLFAGQISGVEGYTESMATGMLAGLYAARRAQGLPLAPVPRRTALGSLVNYITRADLKHFQPANITFDLLEPLEEETRRKIRDKRERHRLQCERALAAFDAWWSEQTAAMAV